LKTESDLIEIEFGGADKIKTELKGETQKLETASRINSSLKKLPDEQKEAKIKEIAASLNVSIPELPAEEFAPMTWEQARAMDARNVKIESHTATHPILTNIPEKRLDFELKTSKKRLEEVLDKRVEHFCYPNGSLNEKVWKAVESSNYKSATTTNYGFNEKRANRFLLNRIDAQSGAANFAQSASGFEAIRQKIGK
jgi:peptidoglycan/xylan/chitin deacetylase (PgdA/CDA1 family)